MQTFLPHQSFRDSASVLDTKRLGKQRVECLQILRALTGKSKGWVSHPATKMWKGYELALAEYSLCIIDEWLARGYKDTCRDKIFKGSRDRLCEIMVMPPWWGREDIHSSHRSNLLRKDPTHYKQFGWTEADNLPYVWPV